MGLGTIGCFCTPIPIVHRFHASIWIVDGTADIRTVRVSHLLVAANHTLHHTVAKTDQVKGKYDESAEAHREERDNKEYSS